MWRLLLLSLVLPVGVTKPATPPVPVPLPEPPRIVAAPAASETPSPDSATRLMIDCNPPDADQPGIVAVCVYQLAPAQP